MGLTKDLEKAFLKSLDNPKQSGNVPQLAVDVAKAIFDFLEKQEFRIVKLESTLDVETIKTTSVLDADVLPSVTTQVPPGIPIANGFGPGASTGPAIGNVQQGKKGVMIPALNLDKNFGQGGSLKVKGTGNVDENSSGSSPKGQSRKSLVKLFKSEIKGK